MAKLTLSDLTSLANANTAVTAINANSALIETALENTLSRDGTSPNTMEAELDMNSNRIINLSEPVSNSEPLRLQDLNEFINNGTVAFNSLPVGGTVGQTLLKNSSTNYDASWGFLDSTSIAYTRPDTSEAIASTVSAKLADFVSVKDFGAVCDGITDDTVAVQKAINACPDGAILSIPAASILVSGSGSAIFTITRPINIIGQGIDFGSAFKVKTGTPTTRDIFHINPTTIQRGFTFKGFSVYGQSGFVGQHTFHLDTSTGVVASLAEVLIEDVYMAATASAGGYSIKVNNGNGNNNTAGGGGGTGSVNGGTFNFTVNRCYLAGGIVFVYAGDSLRIHDSIINTDNAAVVLNQVSGAGNFYMSGCNIAGKGGCLLINQSLAPVMNACVFEQQATCTEANNSMINLIGNIGGGILSAKIINSQVQALAGFGDPTLIRVHSAANTVIDNCSLYTGTAYTHVIITSSAATTILGAGNVFTGGGTDVADAGSATAYIKTVPTSGTITSTASSANAFSSTGFSVTNLGVVTGLALISSNGIAASSFIKSTGDTAGIGYDTGAGGTVGQSTSKTTGVTMNKICGSITTFNSALSAGAEAAFTFTNSTIAATDVVIVNIKSGGTSGAYLASVTAVSAGSCEITLSNLTAGSLSESVVLNFVVIKGVAA